MRDVCLSIKPTEMACPAVAMDRLVVSWPFLHLLFILWFSSSLAKNLETPRYETAYACEGKTLKIECKEGELIRLIRANYGRFSITICNDHGNTDWSVNCMSPKSLRVLHNRCNMKPNCTIAVNNDKFGGEPCEGTYKYVEVHYICTLATTITTTNRPSPPWLITSQPPNVWSTIKPTARPPPPPPRVSIVTTAAPMKTSSSTVSTQSTVAQQPSKLPPPFPISPAEPENGNKYPPEKTEQNHQSPPDEITTLPYTTVVPNKLTEESTIGYKYIPSPSIPWSQDNDNLHYCSPTTARNLYWNWTRVKERTVQPCPGGATGLARWKCLPSDDSSEPHWYPATPDLSECRSVWLTSLESRVNEGDSLISITSDLSQVTSSKTLYGGDMMITTKIIKKMAHKMAEDIQTFPDQRQRETIVTELLHGVVRTGSNLLDSSQHPSWRDLSYKEQMRVATSLLIGLEENAFLLADTVIREKTVVQTVKNIMLSVRVLETKSLKTETFPSEAATDKWSASNDWLQLPREALLENSEGGLVRLVFVAFDRLEEILQWQPESVLESGSAQRNLSRVLNSKVISASLGKGRHIQLSQPVRLSLRHLKTENVSNPSCVFWDYTMSTWSEEGCHVESTNNTHTTCLCDHLTNFAILMDVHATYLPAGHQMALQIITYVGCIISIGCLILTIITFQTFRGLKSDRTTIHKNLCFCLLVAEILFVLGIGQTNERVLCGVIAGLLHLFFLCAFAWMFLEGFQLYVMLIEVFEAEKSRIRWYYLVAYGVPLLIVAISAIIDPFSYGTDQHCWLRADNFFIFSFVGPVIAVILANIVFLVMAIVMMCRHGNASVSMKSKEHSRLASARTWLRGAFVLVFLLGLTWTFGLLYLNKESVVMAYVFTTLNSLQGLFIFVFHCIQNEKVRKEYRKFIRRHSWLPKCLRCSKPNVGGSGSSGSSGLGKERRASLYGGSNGNTSAPNSHSTDNSGLSPHGTSNISFKSYSRDSGHGGSEQEDSPRSHVIGTNVTDCRLSNVKDSRRQPYMSSDLNPQIPMNNTLSHNVQAELSEYLHKNEAMQHVNSNSGKQQQLQQQQAQHMLVGSGASSHQHFTNRKKNNGGNCFLRSASPWNHTYTEIHDGRMHHRASMSNNEDDPDPVYEEIERNEIQVSDMSDEDGSKRQSDMSSRQSSRSYGDHRPLIPYSPAADRSIHSCLEGMTTSMVSAAGGKHRGVGMKEHGVSGNNGGGGGRYATSDLEHHYRMSLGLGLGIGTLGSARQNMYRGENARSLAAVLDGETVVCHLEPPELYSHDSYNSRTMVLPPYSES
ncbi:Calcium-independent receptor for alpha-latrotoxin [Carabus blaptoides fortunei]